MDRSVNATAAEQAGVRGVDHRVHSLLGDVTEDEAYFHRCLRSQVFCCSSRSAEGRRRFDRRAPEMIL
jgi:hypothetical protein